MRKYKILLVDDDPFILKAIGPALEDKGYQVSTAAAGEEAIEIMAEKAFDLVITDLIMQSIDGIDVLKKAKKIDAEMMVMVLTGFGDMNSAIDALRLGADDYMLKPCELEEIYFRVSSCLEKLEFKRKIRIYEDILPVCCVCKSVRDDTGKEPGTGKWTQMENYIRDKGGVGVTSTYCPECAKKAKEELRRGLAEQISDGVFIPDFLESSKVNISYINHLFDLPGKMRRLHIPLLTIYGQYETEELCTKSEQSKVWLRSCDTAGKPGGKRRKQTSACSHGRPRSTRQV